MTPKTLPLPAIVRHYSPKRQQGRGESTTDEKHPCPRLRFGLTSLAIKHVADGFFQALLIANISLAATFGPPFSPVAFIISEMLIFS